MTVFEYSKVTGIQLDTSDSWELIRLDEMRQEISARIDRTGGIVVKHYWFLIRLEPLFIRRLLCVVDWAASGFEICRVDLYFDLLWSYEAEVLHFRDQGAIECGSSIQNLLSVPCTQGNLHIRTCGVH